MLSIRAFGRRVKDKALIKAQGQGGIFANLIHCSKSSNIPISQKYFDLQKRRHNKNYFCYFSTKSYVVDTQKNRLNEHPKHLIRK